MDPNDTIAGNSEKGGSSTTGNQINIDGTPSTSSSPEQGETEIDNNCHEALKDRGKSPNSSPEQGETEIDNNGDGAPNDGGKRENSDKRGTPGKGNKNNINGTPSPSLEQGQIEMDINNQHCYEAPNSGGKSPSSSPQQGDTEIDNNSPEAPKPGGRNSDKQGTPGKGNQNNINGTPKQLNSDKGGTPGIGNRSNMERKPSPSMSPKQGETEIDSNTQHCYQAIKDGGKSWNREQIGTNEKPPN